MKNLELRFKETRLEGEGDSGQEMVLSRCDERLDQKGGRAAGPFEGRVFGWLSLCPQTAAGMTQASPSHRNLELNLKSSPNYLLPTSSSSYIAYSALRHKDGKMRAAKIEKLGKGVGRMRDLFQSWSDLSLCKGDLSPADVCVSLFAQSTQQAVWRALPVPTCTHTRKTTNRARTGPG